MALAVFTFYSSVYLAISVRIEGQSVGMLYLTRDKHVFLVVNITVQLPQLCSWEVKLAEQSPKIARPNVL